MAGQQKPLQVRPWNNLGVAAMATPLYPLPKHPKIWFPKFNPDDERSTDEHLHKYMMATNLSEFSE